MGKIAKEKLQKKKKLLFLFFVQEIEMLKLYPSHYANIYMGIIMRQTNVNLSTFAY